MKNITPETCPNLFNLLYLSEVIDDDTTVTDLDSGDEIQLCNLILTARQELLKGTNMSKELNKAAIQQYLRGLVDATHSDDEDDEVSTIVWNYCLAIAQVCGVELV